MVSCPLPAPCGHCALCKSRVTWARHLVLCQRGTEGSKFQGSIPCGQAQRPWGQGAGGGDEGKGAPARQPAPAPPLWPAAAVGAGSGKERVSLSLCVPGASAPDHCQARLAPGGPVTGCPSDKFGLLFKIVCMVWLPRWLCDKDPPANAGEQETWVPSLG